MTLIIDGTTIYLTRDLGGAYDKYQKYKFDKHIYVVQSAQTLHFNQLFKTLELMDEEFAKPGMLEHINFGMVNGMSTRRGTVKFLDDIIDEATDVMHEQMRSNEAKYAQVEEPERTSAVIGASAVKIQDMSAKRYVSFSCPELTTGSTTTISTLNDVHLSKVISDHLFNILTSDYVPFNVKTQTS
jgi:arginyl-tRNA synthetase